MRRAAIVVLACLLAACSSPTQIGPTAAIGELVEPPASSTPALTVTPQSTPTPDASPTTTLQPTAEPPALLKIDNVPNGCNQFDAALPSQGLTLVAYVPSGFCFNGELDVFEIVDHVYIAQVTQTDAAQSQAAFRIVDVTDAANPVVVGSWMWSAYTYTADIKAFRQGNRWFLAVSRDPFSVDAARCVSIGGIAIIEVTQPANPQLITVLTGETTGSKHAWCKPHTAEISRDKNGDGTYLYVSALDTSDLRVLDIRILTHVTEINHYTHPDAGFYNERNNFFVHDTSIVGDRVYVADWSAGVIILDRQMLESGEYVKPLNPLDSIDPWGLQAHYAYPTADGQFVFVQDEIYSKIPSSHFRMYDIRNPEDPKEVLALQPPDFQGSPHNFVVSGDWLFIGWQQNGVRVYKINTSDPNHPSVEPAAFQSVRASLATNPVTQNFFDGIWGVRLHDCTVNGRSTTCIFASDMTYGLLILAMN